MKIQLRNQDGIEVLELEGSIDAHDMQVLKAGITKLLRAGKNRIILSFADSIALITGDILREIAILDLFAKELAGAVVLATSNEKLTQVILNYTKPSVLSAFPEVKLAVSFFKNAKEESLKPFDSKVANEQLAAKDTEISALKNQLKLLDPREVADLRKKNAELLKQNGMLEEELAASLKVRRAPPTVAAYEQKVNLLEGSLARLTEQLQKAKQ